MSFKFLFFVWNWRKKRRKDVMAAIGSVDQNKVVIFTNRRQLNQWYQKEFGKKIEV